jgi:hypothetical protein
MRYLSPTQKLFLAHSLTGFLALYVRELSLSYLGDKKKIKFPFLGVGAVLGREPRACAC